MATTLHRTSAAPTPAGVQADELLHVQKIARRLPNTSLVRGYFHAHLAGRRLAADELRVLQEIVRLPVGQRADERMVAAWLLGEAPVDYQERLDCAGALIIALHAAVESDGVRLEVPRPTRPAAYAGAALGFGLLYVGLITGSLPGFGVLAAIVGILLVAAVRQFPVGIRMSQVQVARAAALALGRLGVPEAIPALVSVAAQPVARRSLLSRHARRASAAAFAACCYKLTPEQAARVPGNTARDLCKLLASSDEDVTVRTLEALRHVGTEEALEPVRRVLMRAQTPALRQTALTTLDVLEARRQQRLQRERLLRPAPSMNPEVLGRPAAFVKPQGVDRLVVPCPQPAGPRRGR